MIHITSSTCYFRLGKLKGTPKKMNLELSATNHSQKKGSVDLQLKQKDNVLYERSFSLQPMSGFLETMIPTDLSQITYEGGLDVDLYWKTSTTSIVAAWYPNDEVIYYQ
jgi:hypothetical protein